MSKNKLYVPPNITLRSEWWPGFGNKEAAYTAVVTVLLIVFVVIAHFVWAMPVFTAVSVVIVGMGACTTVLQKYVHNLSIVDHLRITLEFMREQQSYIYRYKEVIVLEDTEEKSNSRVNRSRISERKRD